MPARPIAALLLFVAGLALTQPASAAAPECNRECLGALVTQYVEALVARDPSRLPLATTVRVTEDSRASALGEGVWKTISGKGTFRHDYLDVRRQVAATHVHLLEGETPVLYSVLLHVKERRIAGVESLVQRITKDSRFQPTELGKPIRGLEDPVPAAQRQDRESMIRIALTYTEGLRIGSFTDAGTPFAPAAYRVENGVITAGDGCGRPDCGLFTQNIMLHPGIIASVAAVDEEKGVVLLWMNFGHTGNSYGEGNALVTFEAFKVWGGQIKAISAFFRPLPLATARFWPTADKLPSRAEQ